MLAKPGSTLEKIATLELERSRLLAIEFLSIEERKRLKEIRELLPTLWAVRRKELNDITPPS